MGRIETRALLIGIEKEKEISRQDTPEFLLLFEQSILLALKDQGIINDVQYSLCLKELSK